MDLFVVPESFKFIRIVDNKKDEENAKPWKNTVLELFDENSGYTYYFKYCIKLNHTIHFNGYEVKVNRGLANELYGLNFAREIGIDTCYFTFAYYPAVCCYGILTFKHTENPKSLKELTNYIEDKVGNNNSFEFSSQLELSVEDIEPNSMISLFKMHLCDLIIFNADRKENDIIFADDNFNKIYPYFDCDRSFDNMRVKALSQLKPDHILRYSLQEFSLLNLSYCIGHLLEPNYRGINEITIDELVLNIPNINTLTYLNSELRIYNKLPNYLVHMVNRINRYVETMYNMEYEDLSKLLVKVVLDKLPNIC